jgi:hypothetical protein
MALVTGPVAFEMGSPETEPGRKPNERAHRATIERSFAIATQEVTVEQFRRFQGDFPSNATVSPQGDCPVNSVSLYEAMAYCNWLSHQEGLAEDAWCYEIVAKRIRPCPDYLSRAGYRLPTEAEWEYTCRAHTRTCWFFGTDADLLPSYGWGMLNANGVARPVGRLMPNDLGLFDVYGNVQEWCQDQYLEDASQTPPAASRSSVYACRGGTMLSRELNMRSAMRGLNNASAGLYHFGFRIARSFPDKE